MNRKEEAIALFNSGFNCSQAVLNVFSGLFKLDSETALKISSGFGSGMRRGQVCGAVSGALMVIGLKEGHYTSGDTGSKNKVNELVQDFELRFEKLNDSIICKELLKYDLSIENELAIIREKDLFNSVCPKLIQDAIDIIEEILLNK